MATAWRIRYSTVEVEERIDADDQVVAVMRLSGRTNELEVNKNAIVATDVARRKDRADRAFASDDAALRAAGPRE